MILRSKFFDELSGEETYEILKARSKAFMIGQRIFYLDEDDVDYKSLHCFFKDGKEVTAYLRAFYADEKTVRIGRVLSLNQGKGYGKLLLEKSIVEIRRKMPCEKIDLHSQSHAVGFYEKCGFKTVTNLFYEADMPHFGMIYCGEI